MSVKDTVRAAWAQGIECSELECTVVASDCGDANAMSDAPGTARAVDYDCGYDWNDDGHAMKSVASVYLHDDGYCLGRI